MATLSGFAETVCANMNDVAIINIKKTAGVGSSDWSELMKVASNEQNSQMLQEQLRIIDPQLVICGGVFDLAKTIFCIDEKDIFMLTSGTQCFLWENRLFLEFVHPMWYSVDRNILFAYAQIVFSNVRAAYPELFAKSKE